MISLKLNFNITTAQYPFYIIQCITKKLFKFDFEKML